jgi:hypothetical protein
MRPTTKILVSTIASLVLVLLWLNLVTIPSIEKEVSYIKAQADSIEALPPKIEYVKGEPFPVIQIDTVEVEVETETPMLVSTSDSMKIYRTAFDDGFIKGTISGNWNSSGISALNFNYRLVAPLYSYTRVDTIISTTYFPKIIQPLSKPTRNKAILLAGFEFGGNQETFSIAPELELITRTRNSYVLRYDLTRKEYWLGVKFPVFN